MTCLVVSPFFFCHQLLFFVCAWCLAAVHMFNVLILILKATLNKQWSYLYAVSGVHLFVPFALCCKWHLSLYFLVLSFLSYFLRDVFQLSFLDIKCFVLSRLFFLSAFFSFSDITCSCHCIISLPCLQTAVFLSLSVGNPVSFVILCPLNFLPSHH